MCRERFKSPLLVALLSEIGQEFARKSCHLETGASLHQIYGPRVEQASLPLVLVWAFAKVVVAAIAANNLRLLLSIYSIYSNAKSDRSITCIEPMNIMPSS